MHTTYAGEVAGVFRLCENFVNILEASTSATVLISRVCCHGRGKIFSVRPTHPGLTAPSAPCTSLL